LFAGLMLVQAPIQAARVREGIAKEFIAALAARASGILARTGQDLGERERALRGLLHERFALPFIARIALGKYWRRLKGDGRNRYVDLFGEFVLKAYGMKIAAFKPNDFRVVGAVPRGKWDVVVESRVRQSDGGPPIRVGWRVREIGGSPRIIDILIEGVSMALNERQEFSSVVSHNGLSGLMEMLAARASRLSVEPPAPGDR